jgi:hypothetical protein
MTISTRARWLEMVNTASAIRRLAEIYDVWEEDYERDTFL